MICDERHKSEENEFKIVKKTNSKHACTQVNEINNTSMHTGMRAKHTSEKCVYKIIKREKTRTHATHNFILEKKGKNENARTHVTNQRKMN